MRTAAAPLVAAHLNYALSADAKVCTAKSLGLWLTSRRRADRAGFVGHVADGGGLTAARLAAARARLVDGINVSAPRHGEGRVVVPSNYNRAHVKS